MPRIIGCKQMTTNRRITLPSQVTDRLKIGISEYLDFIEDEDGKIYIRKASA